jgi:hypothetical protein
MKIDMKKIFAFLSKKNGAGKTEVKENEANGDVTFTAADAAHLESLAGELETAQESVNTITGQLTEANTARTTAENALTAANANLSRIATALELEANATIENIESAIADLQKVPGSNGADPKLKLGAEGAEGNKDPFAHITAEKKKMMEGWK